MSSLFANATSSTATTTASLPVVEENGSDVGIRFLILLPHVGIALVSWIQTVLSLNRFSSPRRITRPELLGLSLFLSSAIVRWLTSIATRKATFRTQVFGASTGSLMAFSAFVVIYNDRIDLPSRQQANSLLLVLVVTALWETVTRLILDLEDAGKGA